MIIKYRVYHYYPEDERHEDYLDLPTKEIAIEHYNRSRSAYQIRQIVGTKVGLTLNRRTLELE